MTAHIQGLRALITGGSSGIGLATARRLATVGVAVAVLDIRPPQEERDLHFVQADVTRDSEVRQAVDAAVETLGGLDILVNNAGMGAQGTIEDNCDEDWHRVFDINVVGMVRVARACLPALRGSSYAAIVNTCSAVATIGLPRRALYTATKGAVLALTRAMAADHLPDGIRVNCVNPGTTDTPWIQGLLNAAAEPKAERAALIVRQPHGRLVTAEEVAEAIAYLALPGSGSTTGAALEVDGGLTSFRPGPQRT